MSVKLSDTNDFVITESCVMKSNIDETNDTIKLLSLDNCLTCSGCLTSSEQMILENFNLDHSKQLLNSIDSYE